uniref:Chloride channel protein n=1 Tax=Panagrellus redivivus TaxID=6233 RepID=A0A7E4VW05_PANRE
MSGHRRRFDEVLDWFSPRRRYAPLDATAWLRNVNPSGDGYGTSDEEVLGFDDDLPHGAASTTVPISDFTVQSKCKYSDFSTIDWPLELARDRQRRKNFRAQKVSGCLPWLKFFFDSGSAWFCVFAVGIWTGVTSAVVDIGEGWMSDLKFGLCQRNFWLNREHCCWAIPSHNCTDWQTWPQIFGADHSMVGHFAVDFGFYVTFAVSMAVFAAVLVVFIAPYAAGSGIAEIKCILSGFVIRRYLGVRTYAVKMFGIILSSASGLSLGKEGPAVHLASCIGNITSRWFPKYANNEAKKREILSASTAAALSVAFGAPIGGVMFSLEEASYYFTFKTLWRSFFCALIAGLAVRGVNPWGNSLPTLYHVEHTIRWVVPELIPFVVIGILAGLLGSAFIKLNMALCAWRKSSSISKHPIAEVAFITFVTTILAYSNPFTKMSSSLLIRQMFNNCGKDSTPEFCYGYPLESGNVFYYILGALVLKFIFTTVTAGIKVPAGLFVPNIAVGALLGRLVALSTQWLVNNVISVDSYKGYCKMGENCVTPGLYAIVGAAAVLSGVMRMTVTLVIIMFELTGSIEFVVPTMIGIMFAKWVGDATHPVGIYEAQIDLCGYPFLDNRDDETVEASVGDLLAVKPNRELIVLEQAAISVGRLVTLLRDTSFCVFPVVTSQEEMIVVGFIDRVHLERQLAAQVVPDQNATVVFGSNAISAGPGCLHWEKLVDMAPICVNVHMKIEIVVEMFRKLGLRQVLVTNNGHLLGVITKKDLLKFVRHN